MKEQTTLEAGAGLSLKGHSALLVHQRHELGEIFLNFETRNKYEVLNESGQPIAFAAEQQKGMFGFLMRQFLGHWRSFDIHFFSGTSEKVMEAHHPFRFFFQRLDVKDARGRVLGGIQRRFSILSKRFDVQNERGMTVMQVSSPLWKPWTFPFSHNGVEIACIRKKFSGALSELFTDKDNFKIEYIRKDLSENERMVILAASIFVDLMYFERKD